MYNVDEIDDIMEVEDKKREEYIKKIEQMEEAKRLWQEVIEEAPTNEEKKTLDQLLSKIGVWFMEFRIALGVEYDG